VKHKCEFKLLFGDLIFLYAQYMHRGELLMNPSQQTCELTDSDEGNSSHLCLDDNVLLPEKMEQNKPTEGFISSHFPPRPCLSLPL